MIGAATSMAIVDTIARRPSPFGSGGGASGKVGVICTGALELCGVFIFGSISDTNYTAIYMAWIQETHFKYVFGVLLAGGFAYTSRSRYGQL